MSTFNAMNRLVTAVLLVFGSTSIQVATISHCHNDALRIFSLSTKTGAIRITIIQSDHDIRSDRSLIIQATHSGQLILNRHFGQYSPSDVQYLSVTMVEQVAFLVFQTPFSHEVYILFAFDTQSSEFWYDSEFIPPSISARSAAIGRAEP